MSEASKAEAAKTDAPEGADAKEDKMSRLQALLVEYGSVGIVVLLSLSALTYLGFAAAFLVGFDVEGAGETATVLGAAAFGWALTKPVRIPAAILLTPFVARIWRRVRRKEPEA
ncbi:MAG: hypothetical protein AAF799_30100 [Myxococcota bacterium]